MSRSSDGDGGGGYDDGDGDGDDGDGDGDDDDDAECCFLCFRLALFSSRCTSAAEADLTVARVGTWDSTGSSTVKRMHVPKSRARGGEGRGGEDGVYERIDVPSGCSSGATGGCSVCLTLTMNCGGSGSGSGSALGVVGANVEEYAAETIYRRTKE